MNKIEVESIYSQLGQNLHSQFDKFQEYIFTIEEVELYSQFSKLEEFIFTIEEESIFYIEKG